MNIYDAVWIGIGLIISVGVGHLGAGELIAYLRKRSKPPQIHSRATYNWLLGCLERFVYTITILMGSSWFIGVWLGMKGLGRWTRPGWGTTQKTSEQDNHKADAESTIIVNTFLIGNLMSVIFGFIGAFIIRNIGKVSIFTQ